MVWYAANYRSGPWPAHDLQGIRGVGGIGSHGESFVTDSTPQAALRRLLEGFTPRDDEGEIWSQESIRIDVERNKLPVPRLVLFLLLGVMGMTDLGRDDKTVWQVPFSFRGHRVTMASQKFGLRLYVIPAPGSEETAEVIAGQVVTRLRKALRIVERNVLADYAKVQLDHGRLTIANRAHWHRGMYRHFRDAAVAAFTAAEHPPGPPAGADITEIFAGLGDQFRQSQVGAWEAIAAVGAYFSLLEHELVLVSAFADVTSEGGALLLFIGDWWSDKFHQLFDMGDAATNRVHQHLHEIAEAYRNPYSHGGFLKQGASLWFHLEGIGAIPAGLSDIRSSPHFELFPVRAERFGTICTELDATDKWLRNGIYQAGFEWIDAGLDVAFDADSRREYQALADAPPEARAAAISRESEFADRAANMDF